MPHLADYSDMSARPRVSVIVTAFNLAHYLPAALDSALAQESPGGPIQIIVVDDGSTDNTQEVLAAYADRVEVIRQENGGLVKAVDTGLSAVRGEYVALLDADDEWPRDRLRHHAEILDANPQVGLVHGDMEVIDADGNTIHPSFFTWKQDKPSNGRVLARLVKDNFVSGGASTFRASLMPAIWPIPSDAAYPDWWIASNIAAVAEILYDPANANRYRYHGGNMGLGADRTAVLAIERRELPYRRWAMRNLTSDETIDLRSLSEIVMRWRATVGHAAISAGGSIRNVMPRDEVAAAAEQQTAAGHPVGLERCRALARALSHDPLDGATTVDVDVAFLQASELNAPPAPLGQPLISLQTRPMLVLAWLHDLVSRPALLRDFAAESLARDDLTLAILAPDGADLSGLIALVESDPTLSDERCDLRVISEPATWPARRLLAARAGATLTAAGAPGDYAELPAFAAAAAALAA